MRNDCCRAAIGDGIVAFACVIGPVGGDGAYSGVIRPLIPKVSGHPFRFYPATDSGASGHPCDVLLRGNL